MGRKIIIVCILLLITGCAEFDLYIKKGKTPAKVSKVLIGSFEFRNMAYDPYVSNEYREALKFEFFKREVDAVLISENGDSSQELTEKIPGIAAKYKGDIFIRGIITQRETGFLTDREIHSSVNFIIYSSEGKQIGESYYYTVEPAADESVKRAASGKFVKEFLEHIINR